MGQATLNLVTFSGPDGKLVHINPAMVNMIGAPTSEQLLHSKVRCVIFLADGKFATVVDSCDEVRAKLGQ